LLGYVSLSVPRGFPEHRNPDSEAAMREDRYGDYILKTGGATTAWENVFNRYLFESRFRGKAPILDIGPGRCAFTRQDPQNVIAVDNSPSIVARYGADGLDVRLGSATDLPFEDAFFEAAFACWILEHLPEPERCVREVGRTLRRNGYFCAIVPSAQSLSRGFYDDYTHVRPFTPASLRQLAAAAGFSRFVVSYLFWTRGVRRLLPLVREDGVLRLLRLLDMRGRHLATNRFNLMLEAWK
jgi:SAM-dependent methyltransferase